MFRARDASAILFLALLVGPASAWAESGSILADRASTPVPVVNGVWSVSVPDLLAGSLPIAPAGEVKARKRVAPRAPDNTKELPTTTCVAWLTIDEQGAPLDIDLAECPEAFRSTAREAASKWRFDEWFVNGKASRFSYRLSLVFKGDLPPEPSAAATSSGPELIPEGLVPASSCPWITPAPLPEFQRPFVPGPSGTAIYALDCTEGAPPMASRVYAVPMALRRWSAPEYPANTPSGVCRVHVYIDPTGVPNNVSGADCPAEHRDSVTAAVRTWRFVAPVLGEKRRNSNFLLDIDYKAPATP